MSEDIEIVKIVVHAVPGTDFGNCAKAAIQLAATEWRKCGIGIQ